MMENFKQEFKIYCETVENIKGLEILKQNLFDNVLNLEVFIDDCIEIDISEASNEEIIQQAIKIEGLLSVAINQAGYINTLTPRNIYKVLNKCNLKLIKQIFQYTITDCFEYLYTKRYPRDFYIINELEDKYIEDWYKELLKPFKQKREKFTHISDIWKNKLDYEMITKYIEDNKVLMDAIEKQMIKEGTWPLGDGLWN